MLTPERRGWIAEIARRAKRCPSDLTDEERERITPPKPERRGLPRKVGFRDATNTVRLIRAFRVCLAGHPARFGVWRRICNWFRAQAERFLFQIIDDVALMLDRELGARKASS